MARTPHDTAKKTAVLEALKNRQPVTHIHRTMGIPIRTIYCWRSEALAESGAPEASAPTDTSGAPAPEASAPIAPRAPRATRPASVARPIMPESETALRAELRATQAKLSILRQALSIVLEG